MEAIRRPTDERNSRTRRSWILLGIGIGFTILMGCLSLWVADFDAWGAAGLTLVAGIFQVLSVIVASRTSPAEEAVRLHMLNALHMATRINNLRTQTEKAYETGTAETRRKHLGEVSAAFVYLQDNAELNFHGWASIYPNLLNSPGTDRAPKETDGDA